MISGEFHTRLYFFDSWIAVTLSRDFLGNCLTKDPFSHSHPQYELLYLLQGSCTVELENETRLWEAGSFVLLPPHCVHRLRPCTETTQSLSLTFGPESGERMIRLLDTPGICLIPDHFDAEARLLRIREEWAQGRPVYTQKIQGELMVLLADIFRAIGNDTATNASSEEDRSQQIQSYLMEHRFNPDCSCEELAEYLHLSTRQVQRLCLQYYGVTFRKMLTAIRMEIATHRLRTTDIPVGDLALQLGYTSVASFSAAYKRYFNHPPTRERFSKIRHKIP